MSNHGGKRKGAGRPPVPAADRMQTVSVRLPQWMVDGLDKIGGDRSSLVRCAVTKYYKMGR